MEIIAKRKEKKSARKQVEDWITKAEPSAEKAWVFHDSNTLLQSKRVILSEIVRRKLHYKGYRASIKTETLTPEVADELGLSIKIKKGYEPILVWLLKKEKK